MYDIFSEFADFFDSFDVFGSYVEVERCPVCNQSYQDFKKRGRFGCSKCYETFKNPVSQVLKQMHQNNVHTGKIPNTAAAEIKKKKMYEDLKRELSEAVKLEDYEKAAKLHKELKALGNVE